MKRLVLPVLLLLLATPLLAATTRNDDSCDIGLFPAATLLLPYFEVDYNSRTDVGETTIFTITNTSPLPQAARVTLWTSFAYPVMSFNIFLTGYDVQKINLYDVIAQGRIAPDVDLSSNKAPRGELSDENNPRLDEQSCINLPGAIPAPFLERIQSALSTGRIPAVGSAKACNNAGPVFINAVGYATIDVVGACTPSNPTDAQYFTHEIRFDNVLAGDYIQINGAENFAQGNPLVHIRAVPEGGSIASRRRNNLHRTFYGRYQSEVSPTLDARQPLPSVFAARWIDGGPGGFETYFRVWRESNTNARTECVAYAREAEMSFHEITRFDEDENPETFAGAPAQGTVEAQHVIWPAMLVDSRNADVIPPTTQGALGGWIYFNLHNFTPGAVASQNWVTTSMRAEDRFSVDVDAVSLGNGCTPVTPVSGPSRPIGPAADVNP